jgi:hypothetical protein
MKTSQIFLFLLASLIASSVTEAQTLDWPAVENLPPDTRIWVKAQQQTYCYFQGATNDRLLCQSRPTHSSPHNQSADLVFNRADVREVRLAPTDDYDYSKGPLDLILALGGGGGWDFARQPNAFAGVKVGGGPAALDLQYDRTEGHNGFSAEGSAVIPLFRVPAYQPFSTRKFVKFYGEPGVGYRAGDVTFGGYSSAKVLAILLTDTWSSDWLAPYVEFQRRFPFDSPLQGDNRLTFGVMLAVCNHGGID